MSDFTYDFSKDWDTPKWPHPQGNTSVTPKTTGVTRVVKKGG